MLKHFFVVAVVVVVKAFFVVVAVVVVEAVVVVVEAFFVLRVVIVVVQAFVVIAVVIVVVRAAVVVVTDAVVVVAEEADANVSLYLALVSIHFLKANFVRKCRKKETLKLKRKISKVQTLR